MIPKELALGLDPRVGTGFRIRSCSNEIGRSEHNSRAISQWRIVLGKHFSLVSSDSFKLGAYRADPTGPAKVGIVLIREIFGVNHNIRAVCDPLAGEGYAALAPAVFDRQQPNFECGYSPGEIANASGFVANPG